MPRIYRPTTTQRGYGWAHQRVRRDWQRRMDEGAVVLCPRCDERIQPGEAWDLGHTDDRRGWQGPEHAKCNRGAGGKKGNQAQRTAKSMIVRDW